MAPRAPALRVLSLRVVSPGATGLECLGPAGKGRALLWCACTGLVARPHWDHQVCDRGLGTQIRDGAVFTDLRSGTQRFGVQMHGRGVQLHPRVIHLTWRTSWVLCPKWQREGALSPSQRGRGSLWRMRVGLVPRLETAHQPCGHARDPDP